MCTHSLRSWGKAAINVLYMTIDWLWTMIDSSSCPPPLASQEWSICLMGFFTSRPFSMETVCFLTGFDLWYCSVIKLELSRSIILELGIRVV